MIEATVECVQVRVPKPPPLDVWVVVYRNGAYWRSSTEDTEAEANQYARKRQDEGCPRSFIFHLVEPAESKVDHD